MPDLDGGSQGLRGSLRSPTAYRAVPTVRPLSEPTRLRQPCRVRVACRHSLIPESPCRSSRNFLHPPLMLSRTSPLRVEINPWALDVNVEEVMKLRGAYVAAMATIETTLTELAIRASKHPQYAAVRPKFPSRRPDRIKYLRSVCERDGPLSAYRGFILGAVARFDAGLHFRDMLAHGRMQIISFSSGDATIKLEDYSADGEFIKFRVDNVQLSSLRARAHRMARLSRCVDFLYARLGDRLPLIEGEYQGTKPLPDWITGGR